MLRRTFSVLMLTLLSVSTLTLAFNIQPVKANGTKQNHVITHPHATELPLSPTSNLLSSIPPANYDEQIGLTFTQNFSSIAYNVTAVSQSDVYGYGPAYLLNGVTDLGYWYQVGLSYNWPYASGGHVPGFNLNYEVFDPNGNSIFPINGGGGLSSFSGQVSPDDTVLLNLYFSSGKVYMYAEDWKTKALAYQTYSGKGATYFVGLPSSSSDKNGFFSGLMTEWYHADPYYGNEEKTTYSNYTSALTAAWMWIDEFDSSNSTWIGFSDSTNSSVQYVPNPNQLQSFSSHGATEFSDAYEFVTGLIEPIYIRADGSVEGTTYLQTADNVTYVMAADINTSIVVERSNIIIDGNGHAVHGAEYGAGIDVSGRKNVTVKNTQITAFVYGILLNSSSNDNIIFGNSIWNSSTGIWLESSSNNILDHNNIINNSQQVYSDGSVNTWDDGYPAGGNYWSDYTGVDEKSGPRQNLTGNDGIGDSAYVIDANNTDHYPLMQLWILRHNVAVVSVLAAKTVVGRGFSGSLTVLVTDTGDYTETFNVTLYANATAIGAQEVSDLSATNTMILTFTWNATGFAYGNYTISAVADTVPNEADTTDNNCTCNIPVHVGVPGDISGPTQGVYDGTTNMRDVAYMITLFNTKPGAANWNPNADVNNDQVLNMKDIATAIINFNQHE